MSRGPAGRTRARALAAHVPVLVLALVVAAAPVPGVRGQEIRDLSLEDALALADLANPTLVAARLRRPVGDADVAIARERPNPELTFDVERETPHQAITVALPIETAGKRGRRVDLAAAAVASTDAEIVRVRADVRAAVRVAYFDLVGAAARAGQATDLADLAHRVRDAAQARFAAGDVPRLDAVQTDLAALAADDEVTAAEGEVRAARAALNALLGRAPDAPLAASTAFDEGLPLPPADVARAAARQANPDLVALDRQIVEQAARRDLARSLRVPDLVGAVGFTYDAQPEFRYGWRTSIGLTLPLFTRHDAAVRREDAELARLRAEREAAAARIDGETTAALVRAQAARARLDRFREEILPRIAEGEQMAEEGYRAGQTRVEQLLQTLQALRAVRLQGLQAGIDFQSAVSDLQRATGGSIR